MANQKSNYNHGPKPAVVHPIHRWLNEDQKNEALDLLKVGLKPKNVILRLMNQGRWAKFDVPNCLQLETYTFEIDKIMEVEYKIY
jgi:hypothetical protein